VATRPNPPGMHRSEPHSLKERSTRPGQIPAEARRVAVDVRQEAANIRNTVATRTWREPPPRPASLFGGPRAEGIPHDSEALPVVGRPPGAGKPVATALAGTARRPGCPG
jgi:hypothetical protein